MDLNSNSISRRAFVKTVTLGSVALAGGLNVAARSPVSRQESLVSLYDLCENLSATWGKALLNLQVLDKNRPADYGGIWCPARQMIHGRVGDAIYPFFHLAKRTGQHQYLEAAMLLYQWMETQVSQADGSWLNEVEKGSWKGTTVFTIIALCETLRHHSDMMDVKFKDKVVHRVKHAGQYVYDHFSMAYGNINYPIAASYALTLLGTLLDVPKFTAKGRAFAHAALNFITATDHFIYGEGDQQPSAKGCYAVDLGYNVEESLPSLILYGLLEKDTELLEQLVPVLQSHMAFMLPDGGWDNSWGTRNYKWTYWGSRTSDGCQPAYALMADYDPRFYKAALLNTKLLERCTHDGLLYGGLHNKLYEILPSVHHTFCHIKALTTVLDQAKPDYVKKDAGEKVQVKLPLEEITGIKFFSDIQTWQVSKGKFRVTVTAYDKPYKNTMGGHATGGAITMLWHEDTGPILTASMNEYQLFEAGNMQPEPASSMPLTPRIVLVKNGATYMNVSDYQADVEVQEENDRLVIITRARLVDKAQCGPDTDIRCTVTYIFTDEKVTLNYAYDQASYDGSIEIILPVISGSNEEFSLRPDNVLRVQKNKHTLQVSADRQFTILPSGKGQRVFNLVPGLEAIPLAAYGNPVSITISVK